MKVAGLAAAAVLVLGLSLQPVAAGANSSPSPGPSKIDPWLERTLGRDGRASFLVRFDSSERFRSHIGAASRTVDAHRAVYDTLRGRARSAQDRVRRWLDARGTRYRSLYVVNALRVEGDASLARALAAFPEVDRVVGDPKVRGIEGWSAEPADSLEAIEWGLLAIRAPDVWATDQARGEGIVIASADTGVEWNHPALRSHYRGWNGSVATHDYNWHDAIDDLATPIDDYGHGTHTTGTMIGDDGASNQIGVAPGAKWIGCRNMDFGNGSPSTYLECIQFFLAPWPHGGDPELDGDPSRSPDIVNNSWGCPPSEGCDPDSLADGFAALQAAGILAVVSAGNSGPSCSSVDSPPAIYGDALVVGATDSSGALAGFSSRGPVLVDGSGRLRPDLSAPGVSVRSSVRNSAYSSGSGTSMAGPHVAGSAALLWSARSGLRRNLELTRCLLTRSAKAVTTPMSQVCGGTGSADHPNNLFGWGLVNPYTALHPTTDGDGDGIADDCDCAAADGSAFDPPKEVGELTFEADRTTLSWKAMSTLSGSGTIYDVIRGTISDLIAQQTTAGATCLASGLATPALADATSPATDEGFYYLVRARNSCGLGGWGAGSNTLPREHAACP